MLIKSILTNLSSIIDGQNGFSIIFHNQSVMDCSKFEVIVSKSLEKEYYVAVIGAGPAGLYAAQFLARRGVNVLLFNRDIKPGGLAEYGIYPTKYKLRKGLLAQFKRILALPKIKYMGNVIVGEDGDFQLDQLREAGLQAIMVTIGAQQNKWIGLPGENLGGVYQAQEIVYHYNRLPTHADMGFSLGRQVVVIGVGNVMLDILRYLKETGQHRLVTAYARRGPTEVKFDKQTLKPVAACIDLPAVKSAVESAQPMVEAVGKDIGDFYSLLQAAREEAEDCNSGLKFRIQFLKSPKRIIGDEDGRVIGVEFELNRLYLQNGRIISRGTGVFEMVPADTVIFSIGSLVESNFGLPLAHNHFVTTTEPRFPILGNSYEVFNPDLGVRCEDVFVSGWARMSSEGVVGLARQDAERGSKALLAYLETQNPSQMKSIEAIITRLPGLDKRVVDFGGLQKIWKKEEEIANEQGLPVYKFDSNAAMLRVIEGPN